MSAQGARPERLRPAPAKWLALALGSIALASGGAALRDVEPLLGCACMVLFGLCALVALLNLWPGASRLVLDDDGFELVALFRRWRVRWADVARVGEARAGLQRMVGFDYATTARDGGGLRRLNRRVSGFDAGLPDTYGQRADALAARMQARLDAWRQRQPD